MSELGTINTRTNLLVQTGLFNHIADVGNVGTGEDDLYSDTIPANELANNEEKIIAIYSGVLAGSGVSTQTLRAYFGGTLIYDSGGLTIAAATPSWTMNVVVIRESSTVVRCTVYVDSDFATILPSSQYTRITGLTLSNTQILKITGEAAGVGAANDQIVAKFGYGMFQQANTSVGTTTIPFVTVKEPYLYDNVNTYFREMPVTLPGTSWTWFNQGSSTEIVGPNGDRTINKAASIALNSGREVAVPGATPWTLTTLVLLEITEAWAGIYVRDNQATPRYVTFRQGNQGSLPTPFIGVSYWTSPATFSSNAKVSTGTLFNYLWMRVNDNGTNLTWSFSSDGINYFQYFQASRTAWLTTGGPTHMGFLMGATGATAGGQIKLLSWAVT